MRIIREEHYKWVWALIFVLIAILSYTFAYDYYLNSDFIKSAIIYLDKKANVILGLTGASTSASVAMTLIPGDVGTPIAGKLADISSYSIIILTAVHLEKYLITIAAEIALRCIVPGTMLFSAINTIFLDNLQIGNLMKKLCTFALALILVVPASVKLSTLIEKTYEDDVQMSIEETQREADEIKNNLVGQDQNIIAKFWGVVAGKTAETVKNFENSLNNFVEAIAVMIITACVIPLVTFAMLIWLIKSVLQVDFQTPSLASLASKTRLDPNKVKEIYHGRKQDN